MAHASQVSIMRPPGRTCAQANAPALLSSFVKMCAGAWTSTRPPAAAGISFAFLMARRAQRQPLSAIRPSCRSDQLVSRPRTLASRQACASAAKCPAQMTEVEGEDDRTVQNQSSCRRRHRCQEHGRHCRCHRLPIHNGRILTMYVNAETQSDARAEPVRPIGIAWRQHPWCLIS